MRRVLAVGLVLLAFAGCGDDDDAGASCAELQGRLDALHEEAQTASVDDSEDDLQDLLDRLEDAQADAEASGCAEG